MTIQSAGYKSWKRIDRETQPREENGKFVTDHPRSAEKNFDSMRDMASAIPGMWSMVMKGEAVMGGGSPKSRVARAEPGWDRIKTAIIEHGENAAMAAILSVSAGLASATDGLQGLVHSALSLASR